MSANLIDGVKPTITQYGSMADGVITSLIPKDQWKDVAQWPITTGTLAVNQTMHLGISAKWHGAAATTGSAWASVKYADAAGSINNVNIPIDGITTEWKRFSLSAVVPSGMHIVDFHISGAKLDAAYDATNPVLSYGSPVVLAQAEATVSYVKDGKSPTISVSKSGTVTTITVTNPDGSKSTQKVLDGTNGTPGAKGADGRTTYTHVKYSNDGGKTFTSNSGEDAGAYIGICTDFNSADPTAVGSYKWAKIKGDTGATGPQGPKGETGAAVKSVMRYYQLLPSGSSAPSLPASSSNLGSWTAAEPSADTSKDLWQCECTKLDDGTETWSAATKSSAYEAAKSVSTDVTKLSDKVTATVSEQMKWNDSYASRASSLEQTAAGISASLDSMSSTDASIHQWMSFAKGTDGKPTLTIGTSDSDIVSRQTNSGLSYETRGGTELLALDAVSRSSTMPHMHADDVSLGSWQWMPTKNGTHFTLMWIGG